MFKRWSLLLLAFSLTLALALPMGSGKAEAAPVSNFFNVIKQDGADPWMYKHTDGYYYYTQTTGNNITLWRSKTITGIDAGDSAVVWTPPAGTMYSSNIWAPELHYLDGKWYVYFAADNGSNENHRMYVLENANANPLAGGWTFKGKIADASDRWAIDGTVLTVGASRYFIWSGWEGTVNDKQHLYIAQMSNPWTISSARTRIATPTYSWETNTTPQVNEGPQVIVRGSTISLVYSASGSWTDGYCLGLVTAGTSANLLNAASWTKKSAPLFASANGIYGPGHHSFTKSPDGTQDWLVYHAARWQGSGWTRNVRTQPFGWNADNTPNLGAPVNPNAPIAKPAGEPGRDRYEAESALLAGGAAVANEASASGGKKVGYLDTTSSYAQFTVSAPSAGWYVLAVRNGNGTSGQPWAIHSLSVNGGAASSFYVAYSGWNNWGASTAKVYLNAGTNTIRFTGSSNYAEIDCMDIFPAG